MVAQNTAEMDSVFRAISDPTRRRILELLAEDDMAVNDLCDQFEISQPAISQHMRVLRKANLVDVRTEWRSRIYFITPKQLKEVLNWVQYFENFWDEALDKIGRVVKDMDR